MQKTITITMCLTLALLSNISMGQTRNCDLELTEITSPVEGTSIPSGETFFFAGTIKNNGPDNLKAGDTIYYVSPGTQDGRVTIFILAKELPKGGSMPQTFHQFTIENTTKEDIPVNDFCAVLFLPQRITTKEGKPIPSWSDPDSTNNKYCTSFIIKPAEEDPTVSIVQKESRLPLTCYPNPATDKIHILLESLKGQLSGIRLLDICGRVVLHKDATEFQDISGNRAILDVSAISAGTYIVEVQSDREKAVTKIVLQD